MSPIDDELRRAMHARADGLSPSPNPLAGIERRAYGMRRRRASVAGAALAAVAIGVAVPLLVTSGSAGRAPRTAQVAGPVSASPAPSPTASPTSGQASSAEPLNLLTWQARGSAVPAAHLTGIKQGFAAFVGNDQNVEFRALFSTTHHGLTVTVGQAWKNGELAYDVGYATGGANGPELFIGRKTVLQTPVVAFNAAGATGSGKDLLVLVPRPGTGQVSYSPDATAAFSAVASGRSDIDAVGLVDRDPKAQQDRVEILDGDGNRDKPLYRGGAAALLCGAKECG
jgi:hypothetical protein